MLLLVALNARDIFMFAIKFKSRLVVIETRGHPFFRRMTDRAVGNTILFKLPEMLIYMTIIAFSRESGELLLRNRSILAFDVTIPAVYF